MERSTCADDDGDEDDDDNLDEDYNDYDGDVGDNSYINKTIPREYNENIENNVDTPTHIRKDKRNQPLREAASLSRGVPIRTHSTHFFLCHSSSVCVIRNNSFHGAWGSDFPGDESIPVQPIGKGRLRGDQGAPWGRDLKWKLGEWKWLGEWNWVIEWNLVGWWEVSGWVDWVQEWIDRLILARLIGPSWLMTDDWLYELKKIDP